MSTTIQITCDKALLKQYLDEFFEHYLTTIHPVKPDTIKAYKNSLKLLLNFLVEVKHENLDRRNIDSINAQNITDYIAWLESERKCSNNAINNNLTALRAFLNFCSFKSKDLNNKYYELNAIIKASFRSAGGRLEYLTKDQLNLLLSVPDLTTEKGRRNKLILTLICNHGMRVSEILSLKISDLIKNNETYDLIKVVSARNKERILPLIDSTQKLLCDYLNEFHPNLNGNDYLFFGEHLYHNEYEKERTKLSESSVNIFLRNYAKQAHSLDPSFPKSISITMLRHSFAIAMIEAGMRYIDLTYLLGNRSLSFMEEYYKAKQEDSDSNLHLLKILEKITNQLS